MPPLPNSAIREAGLLCREPRVLTRLSAVVSVAGVFTDTESGKRAAMREEILGVWEVPPERIT